MSQKLIDRLHGRAEFGELVGILGTTFEADQDFLEMDFLPSLLGLRSWDDRNWSSRIRTEQALAGMQAVVLLADARVYRGRPRSLRIEHRLVTRPGGARFHPKILLLVYERAVRLQIGSANLTEPGYRRNHEVVVGLTSTRKAPGDHGLIRDALGQIEDVLGEELGPAGRDLVVRARTSLGEEDEPGRAALDRILVSGPGRPLWQDFLARWPAQERVARVVVVSPFWSENLARSPVIRLVEELRRRDQAADRVHLELIGNGVPIGDERHCPVLPAAYASWDYGAHGIEATAQAVDPEARDTSDQVLGVRSLHAKVVLLHGPRTTLAYAGSANFTRRGWGLGPEANIEAGICLLRTGASAQALSALVPPLAGGPVPLGAKDPPELAPPEEEAPPASWPSFLKAVLLRPASEDSETLELVLECDPVSIPGGWRILDPRCDVALPAGQVAPEELVVPLVPAALDRLLTFQQLEVEWGSPSLRALVPVNVDRAARDGLPMAPGTSKPGESELVAYYQGHLRWEELFPPPPGEEDDGETRNSAPEGSHVDTSRIQTYQVREFVEALTGIREELREARHSEPRMRLALLGPISPVTLAEAVRGAAMAEPATRTPVAAGFQLVELLVALGEARNLDGDPHTAQAWTELVDAAHERVDQLWQTLLARWPRDLGPGSRFHGYRRKVLTSSGGPR